MRFVVTRCSCGRMNGVNGNDIHASVRRASDDSVGAGVPAETGSDAPRSVARYVTAANPRGVSPLRPGG